MTAPLANAGANVSGKHPSGPFTAPVVIQLTGSGTPGDGGSTIDAWQWYVDSAGAPEAVWSIDDDEIQNPKITVTSGFGTLRAMLVVTDDQAAESVGPEDLAGAPNEAFVTIELPFPNTGLIAEGAGERATTDKKVALVKEVDAIRGDLTDHATGGLHTSSATGAQIDSLFAGSAVAGSGHTHPATQISTFAAVDTPGKIQLAEDALNPGAPKAVTRVRVLFTAHWNGEVAPEAGTPNDGQIAFLNINDNLILEAIGIALRDGGGTSGDDWRFVVYEVTAAKYLANSFSGAGVTALVDSGDLGKAAGTNEPFVYQATLPDVATTNGRWLVIRCTQAPTTRGADMTVTLQGRIEY